MSIWVNGLLGAVGGLLVEAATLYKLITKDGYKLPETKGFWTALSVASLIRILLGGVAAALLMLPTPLEPLVIGAAALGLVEKWVSRGRRERKDQRTDSGSQDTAAM